ncbi:MAG TPA: helix-turn-helix transcriptional regulator [Gaiellales bacterium]|nr:helix-turn-helix transcriptional regulator [Gaiellales bacterium]
MRATSTAATVPPRGEVAPLVNWAALWHRVAAQCRDLRRLCGMSQEQVATAAGLSQSAIARFESGRCHRFPVSTATRIIATLARASVRIEGGVPSHLLAPLALLREVLPAVETVPQPPRDPELAELLRLYHLVPRAQRPLVLQVMRPFLAHLTEWQ